MTTISPRQLIVVSAAVSALSGSLGGVSCFYFLSQREAAKKVPEPAVVPVVRAERIELVDKSGKKRAELFTGEKGAVSFAMLDASGVRTAMIRSDDEMSIIGLSDKGTSGGATFGCVDGKASASFLDANGKQRLELGTVFAGQPAVRILSPDERPRITLLYTDFMGASINTYGENGQFATRNQVTPEGDRNIEINDEDGNTRASLGTARLVRKKSEVKEDLPPSSLVLFDKKGTVIHQVPMN